MRRRSPTLLITILVLAIIAIWVDLENIQRPEWTKALLFWRPADSRDVKIVEGLDLQRVLRREVREEPALGEVERVGEPADRHALEPDLAREPDGPLQDRVPRLLALPHRPTK